MKGGTNRDSHYPDTSVNDREPTSIPLDLIQRVQGGYPRNGEIRSLVRLESTRLREACKINICVILGMSVDLA